MPHARPPRAGGSPPQSEGTSERRRAARAAARGPEHLVVAEFNVGGLEARLAQVLRMREQYGWDVGLLTETQTRDHHLLATLARQHDWVIKHVGREPRLRKDGRPRTMASGGVAIILFNTKDFILLGHDKDPRGLVTAEVRARSGAFNPYLLACTYMPPITSKRYGHLRDPLLVRAEQILELKQRTYGDRIVWGGDFNARLRTLYGQPRHSHDAFEGVSAREAAESPLGAVLEHLGMAPVVGATISILGSAYTIRDRPPIDDGAIVLLQLEKQ